MLLYYYALISYFISYSAQVVVYGKHFERQKRKEEAPAMFLFYAIHYPHPEKRELLIQRMHELGELIKKRPGLLFVNIFQDPENGTLVGLTLWESQEAFQASWSIWEKDTPFPEWEVKPREIHLLPSAR